MEGESDRAYLSYTTYRDMGATRSVTAAYVIYLKEIGKWGNDPSRKVATASNSFRSWSVEFCWDDRVKAWDLGHAKRTQDRLLAEDAEKYINTVKAFRQELEDITNIQLAQAKIDANIDRSLSARIAKGLSKDYRELSAKARKDLNISPAGFSAEQRELLSLYAKMAGRSKQTTELIDRASTRMFNALGLVKVIEEIQARANEVDE